MSEDDAARPDSAAELEEGELADTAPTAPSAASADEALTTAKAIAKQLHEKKVHLIHALVQHFGGDIAQAALEETLCVEAAGGMTTRDGSRRRDAGGVFLELFARCVGTPCTCRKLPASTDPSKRRVNKTELNRVQRDAQRAWVRRGEKVQPAKRMRAVSGGHEREDDAAARHSRRRGAAADSDLL